MAAAATAKKQAGAGTQTRYECSLYGLLAKDHEPQLRTRLGAICGDADALHRELTHEISCIPSQQTPVGPERRDDHVLRLRIELDPEDPLNNDKSASTVCLLGHPESRTSRGASVRTIISAQVVPGASANASQFLGLLGYKFGSEFVRKGYWFPYHDNFRIIVTQIYRLTEHGNVQSATPIDKSGNWMVHVVADAIGQEQVPRLCEQLDETKRLLEDTVELVVVDHAHLDNKVPYN